MRELKFRYWNPFANKLVYNPIVFKEGWTLEQYFSDRGWTWEQYTGLKDKNGKEIYEGDILREKGLLSLTYLEWDKNHARYKTKVLDESKHVSSIFDFDIIDALECEVIGNIHENPELLEHKG